MRTIKFNTAGKPLKTKRNVAAAIREAADFLEKNPERHISGFLVKKNDNGGLNCYCALGAIDKVCGVKPNNYPAPLVNKDGNVFWAHSLAFGKDVDFRLPKFLQETMYQSLAFTNDHLVENGDRQKVISIMRKYARYLEHGGSL